MTLRELIDKATAIGRQVSTAEIPVIYNGVSDNNVYERAASIVAILMNYDNKRKT